MNEKVFNSLSFHKRWLSVVFTLLFGLGCVPLFSIIFKKTKLLPKMREKIEILDDRYAYVEKTYAEVLNLEKSLEILDKNQYENFDVHHYMIPLFTACTRAGFEVSNFKPVIQGSDNSISLNLAVWGSGDVSTLVEYIEGLEIATQVDSLSVVLVQGKSEISMVISVLNKTS